VGIAGETPVLLGQSIGMGADKTLIAGFESKWEELVRMQVTNTTDRFAGQQKRSLGRRLAIIFCLIASAAGWGAIIGLVLLLKPGFPF